MHGEQSRGYAANQREKKILKVWKAKIVVNIHNLEACPKTRDLNKEFYILHGVFILDMGKQILREQVSQI